jgi:hypothetical protein
MAAIGMAGGIVQTYREQTLHITPTVEKHLANISQCISMAIHIFGRVGHENILQIAEKIDKAHDDPGILGRARSIITFVDYAVWLLESTLTGDKPSGMIKGIRGKVTLVRIINALMELRYEISGKRNYEMCSIAGIKAAERWAAL